MDNALMGFFLGAVVAMCIAGVIVLAVDLNLNQVRRIQSEVARDTARIRRKTLSGWSADRIAARYPNIAVEHIRRVRRDMARNIAADQEIRLLEKLWTMSTSEAEFEL
jgi:hypothetical protein